MVIDERDPIVQTAILGKRVEDFIESDIGLYLIDRADNKLSDALNQLKTVAPWRTRRIRELQNEIWVASSFKIWLQEALSEGIAALNIIEER
jgi:phage tail tape-measure protein